MNAAVALSNLPEWASWTTMSAYMAIGFLAVLVAVVAALIISQFTSDEERHDPHTSHGVTLS